jgi:hypothetical protein
MNQKETVATEEEARTLRMVLVQHGTERVADALQINRESVVRLAAGVPIRPVGLALARANWSRLPAVLAPSAAE